MQKVDETHYKITINTASPNDYKYCSGPDWSYEELDAAGLAISNRSYNAADVVIKWRAVYNPNPTGVTYNVTVPAGTKACYIAGEMNNWTHQSMTKIDETHYNISFPSATTAQKYKDDYALVVIDDSIDSKFNFLTVLGKITKIEPIFEYTELNQISWEVEQTAY